MSVSLVDIANVVRSKNSRPFEMKSGISMEALLANDIATLVPGSGSARTAYLWAYARDDRPFGGSGLPMVAYRFEDSRSGDCVARHLEGYRGILHIDGYTAYNRVARPDRGNTTALFWRGAGRIVDVGFTSCTQTTAQRRLQRRQSKRWAHFGKRCADKAPLPPEESAAVIADLYKLWQDTSCSWRDSTLNGSRTKSSLQIWRYSRTSGIA